MPSLPFRSAGPKAGGRTVKTFLEESAQRLKWAGVASPRLEAEVLLAGALRLGREALHCAPGRVLDEAAGSAAQTFVERRLRREPVAYILGRREFWSLDFKVTPAVLVPRPETEILVETLLNLYAGASTRAPVRILDIGTGSGIIAVVLAREISTSRVTATELSAEALAVAGENASVHGVSARIRFVKGDLFAGAPEAPYDFIVSNPPYIESGRWQHLMPDVRDFEPRGALDGGVDGMEFYRRIVSGAWGHLREGGGLVLETGETQARKVAALIRGEKGFESVRVKRDYGGYDRVVSARKRANG